MEDNGTGPGTSVLFDEIQWQDPLSGATLEPIIAARTPSGVPLCGAMRISGTEQGYPIVDSVARLTPELACVYSEWLAMFGLTPPAVEGRAEDEFQSEATVDSFGFQWSWNSRMRTEEDLRWRIASRFQRDPREFTGRSVLDAGAGAGDQSRWLLNQGARVVSIDLSSAIDVTARKLRTQRNWVGVQGDITRLPFAESQFDVVYCEGVIQHTRDSGLAVRELARVLEDDGLVLATHYGKSTRLLGRLKQGYTDRIRRLVSKWERYRLLLLTGMVAALAYVPVIGRLMRLSGVAVHYDLMPDFKTTWTNTFDYYGNHAYQRHMSAEEFWRCFEEAGEWELVFRKGTTTAARKCGTIRGTTDARAA